MILPDERKTELWNDKFNDLMNGNYQFNSEQRNYISLLHSFVTKEIYTHGISSETELDLEELRDTGYSLFTDLQLRMLFLSLENDGIEQVANGGAGTLCKCSGSSDWCNSPVDVNGKCSTDACDVGSSSGCGTLWGYACNGNCVLGGSTSSFSPANL